MERSDGLPMATELMLDFARRTGLEPEGGEPRRYLWTDAFAVCNFLELHRLTGERQFLDLALRLVDQVHEVLGHHRGDDGRAGWISGLSEEEGARHPTAGGLRIGKRLRERGSMEPMDPHLEWEQDGQYFHYLTKWMHALARVSEATEEPRYLIWAMELAAVAQERFSHASLGGRRMMYWKMSIDLGRPLVASMGQHDALDAYVTYRELQVTGQRYPQASLPDIGASIEDAGSMCHGGSWATDDHLGIGSLLIDAWRVATMEDGTTIGLLRRITAAAAVSLAAVGDMDCDIPATHRLAFREMGLAIGLHAAGRLEAGPEIRDEVVADQFEVLRGYTPLGRRIEAFWSEPRNRDNELWREHEDINAVMLATSLAPGGFLAVEAPRRSPILAEKAR